MIKESLIKPPSPADDMTRVAGRGTVYITASKIWFMISGSGIHFILPRLMSEEAFGSYQVVVSVVSIINAVIVTGTYQTVSKYISQEEEKAGAVLSKALRVQTVIGGAISAAFFLLAPVIAHFLNDPRLVSYLRLASLISLAYSFYSVYTGFFNGQKRFTIQAGLDITYSTLKLAFIVLLVWLGLGAGGGIGGFALAAACILAISAFLARGSATGGDVRARDLVRFQSLLLLSTLVFNLLQKVDIILIKSLSSPDSTVASINAAYYGAAINLANLTYQFIVSATFIIFPLVSQTTFANDTEKTRGYISTTLRYTLTIMALVATLMSANSGEILRVIYPDSFQAGSAALSIVAYGMLLFGTVFILTTIISASGRPLVSLLVGLCALIANGVTTALLVPRFGIAGAAVGTTSAMLVGVIAGGSYLISRFGSLLPWKSIARISISAAVLYALSVALTPATKLMILAQLALLALVYLALLFLTGELGRRDLEMVKKVIRR